MESILGRQALFLDPAVLTARMHRFDQRLLDIGTGDGRFVRHMAARDPLLLAIGLDSCRENLREGSRRTQPNTLFLIAQARALPHALDGRMTWITINFPWGSLLEELVHGEPALLQRLSSVASTGARLELRLNGGALANIGMSLEEGATQVLRALRSVQFQPRPARLLELHELRALPSSWAQRLAFGRDPRSLEIIARR